MSEDIKQKMNVLIDAIADYIGKSAKYVMVDPEGLVFISNEKLSAGEEGFVSDSPTANAVPVCTICDELLIANWTETQTEIIRGNQ